MPEHYRHCQTDKVSYDVNRLKTAYSIPESTFSDWTKDINDELEAQRLERILDLHLLDRTQEEIGAQIGLSQKCVGIKIKEITDFLDVLEETTKSDKLLNYVEIVKKWYVLEELNIPQDESALTTKFVWLFEKYKKISDFTPLIYNVWNINRNNNVAEHQRFGIYAE